MLHHRYYPAALKAAVFFPFLLLRNLHSSESSCFGSFRLFIVVLTKFPSDSVTPASVQHFSLYRAGAGLVSLPVTHGSICGCFTTVSDFLFSVKIQLVNFFFTVFFLLRKYSSYNFSTCESS